MESTELIVEQLRIINSNIERFLGVMATSWLNIDNKLVDKDFHELEWFLKDSSGHSIPDHLKDIKDYLREIRDLNKENRDILQDMKPKLDKILSEMNK